MIINGGSRSNGGFFAAHLMRADHNERVTVTEMRGFAYARDVPEAFEELRDIASGTRCKNFFYHANINTRADERLTPEQWAEAVDKLELELHLVGQPRFVVEHDKEGRTHQHIVWGRIDVDQMTAIPDSHNYRTHELVATELETSFGHEATERALTRDKETTARPEPAAKDWETFRAQESKIDPKAIKSELTELWQQSDSGTAFAAAIEERGYILAKGDRRDFCVIDQAGDEHSLARRIGGVKAADIRVRMAEVERDTLPSVEDARALARSRLDEASSAPADGTQVLVETPAGSVQEPPTGASTPEPLSPFDATPAQPIEGVTSEPVLLSRDEADLPSFESVMRQTLGEARADADATAAEDAGGRWERFNAWLSTMREHVADLGQQVREYWGGHFGGRESESETVSLNSKEPVNIVSTAGAQSEPMQPRDTGPELE